MTSATIMTVAMATVTTMPHHVVRYTEGIACGVSCLLETHNTY